ncbi:SusC/RagA family TonB-linked outer membrane protein [Pedobacter sp. KBS0701]|uniref:SusC/RagA family TonB-linked outer membrane protein n=1 Tax=Pedobacter sp. KBS0701 TaxID=2578106 RepID=UPI00110E1749|nr:SusC/RagA family TonB-linked outer membrane protein [Pedobacter sp. KBS0701]QDW27928.1 SusC/RagA family TonB-linked outer membrane protein [Pedobacter sp. KBS0701]
MKLTTLLMLAVFMQVSAGTYAQKITLSARNAELFTIFDQISDQSGYDFVITNSILKNSKKVTIDVKNAELSDVLDQIFKNQSLEFTITNKSVLVRKKAPAFLEKIIKQFQSIDITGKVLDEKNLPLPGATVGVKGLKKQTVTNTDGEFTLKDVDEDAVLVITFLGYQTREIKASENLGNIILAVQTGQLDEVTVSTGYQTLSKERVTGSFSTVSSKQLDQQRLSSMQSLLEGRIPGYNNGLIRGTTSMNGLVQPLYVIDGFPVENLKLDANNSVAEGIPGLNLEDIESITVLKDAAAASIYGARASNGVIVIVTKKAKKGKPQIAASGTFTLSPYRQYTNNLTNSADIVDLEKEWAANNPNLRGANAGTYAANLLQNVAYPSQGINAILKNAAGTLSQADLNTKLGQLAAGGYQYYDDVEKYSKRSPFYQQYNLSIGNATEKNALYTSATYRNNKTQDKYAGDESLGININNTTQINKWLTMELSTFLSYNEGQIQPYNTLSPGYTFLPYDRLVNADGSNFTSTAASRLSANNMSLINNNRLYNMDITPLDEQAMSIGKTKNFTSRSFVRLGAKITDWLSYKSSFQYEYATSRLNQLYDKNTYFVRSKVNSFASFNPVSGGQAIFNLPYGNINYRENQFNNAYNFRQQLNVDKTFGDKHSFTAILGSEIRNRKIEYDNQSLYNYNPSTLTYSLVNQPLLGSYPGNILGGGSFTTRDAAVNRINIERFVSFYSNVGYAYDEKYLFTGSIRWDKSNLWGTSSKYQNTPIWSFGAGWNIDKESFFNADWVDRLKLRASHGIGGNVYTNSAPFTTFNFNPNYNVGGLQAIIGSRPNPLLSWEKTTTTNAGLDFAIFKNRLSGSVDYYHKSGKDLLANTQGVPTEGFGYSTYVINNGEMLNQGVELALSGDIIRGKDLIWNLGMQYAFNKNKVTYVNIEAPFYVLQLDYPQSFPRIGNPYNAIYSYQWAGLSNTGLPQVYNEKGEKVQASPATLQSIVYSGSTVPKYSGSVNSTLSYQNFSLSFLLTFEGGHKMRDTFLPVLGASYNGALNGYVTQISAVNKDIVNRWRNPGDELKTNIPKVVFAEDPSYNSQSADIYRYADINVLDATNMRLRNISLAYNVPQLIAKKAGLSNIRFQFNVENAFTLAKSKTAKYLLNGYLTPNYVWGAYLNF